MEINTDTINVNKPTVEQMEKFTEKKKRGRPKGKNVKVAKLDPETYDGSIPLQDPMQEKYVQNRKDGKNKKESYILAGYKCKPEYAGQTAGKMERKTLVARRLSYITTADIEKSREKEAEKLNPLASPDDFKTFYYNIAVNADIKDTERLKACASLAEMIGIKEQVNADKARPDPAVILAWLTNVKLQGSTPALIMLQFDGLQRIADAVLSILQADFVTIGIGGDSATSAITSHNSAYVTSDMAHGGDDLMNVSDDVMSDDVASDGGDGGNVLIPTGPGLSHTETGRRKSGGTAGVPDRLTPLSSVVLPEPEALTENPLKPSKHAMDLAEASTVFTKLPKRPREGYETIDKSIESIEIAESLPKDEVSHEGSEPILKKNLETPVAGGDMIEAMDEELNAITGGE